MFGTLTKTAEELKTLKEKMRKKAQTEGTKEMKPIFEKFFKDHPTVTEISWTQYTPYFNDGDECVFRVNDLEVKTHKASEDEYGDTIRLYSLNDAKKQEKYGICKEAYEDLRKIEKGLGDIDEILQDVFGDHARIVVTPKSIEVESYEHD